MPARDPIAARARAWLAQRAAVSVRDVAEDDPDLTGLRGLLCRERTRALREAADALQQLAHSTPGAPRYGIEEARDTVLALARRRA